MTSIQSCNLGHDLTLNSADCVFQIARINASKTVETAALLVVDRKDHFVKVAVWLQILVIL